MSSQMNSQLGSQHASRAYRFYRRETYFCPHCQTALVWENRKDRPDLMLLVHPALIDFGLLTGPLPVECDRNGMKFYPPKVYELTEFLDEAEEAEEGRSEER